MVSEGYPGKYSFGYPISINHKPLIFFSGSKRQHNEIITAGGRVLSVVAFGKDIKEAITKVYNDLQDVQFKGMKYRKDIGSA
ncbi:hypothetical protein FACS1894218_0780 [Bacilli bacterium]|nr:hypothetical protein FACS1894218_0780 [Bacilli bacterium]